MKKFNKVLAVILSLVMLFSVIPAAAFAAETPTNGSQSSGGVQANKPVSTPATVAPTPTGTGADGTVTLTVSVSKLLAALKGEPTADVFLQLLKDMVSGNNAFTMDDLLEIVPINNLIVLLFGDNNENASDLIEQLGGFEEFTEMVDIDSLVATADRSQLADFVLESENIAALFADVANDKEELLKLFGQIAAGETALEDVVDTGALFTEIAELPDKEEAYTDLINIFGADNTVKQLTSDLPELLGKLSPEQSKTLITAVLSAVLRSLEFVSVDGYEIIKASGEGLPSVNYSGLMNALNAVLPTLDELANTDGTLCSFNLYIDYNVRAENGTDVAKRTKDVNINIVLDGDLTQFKRIVAKLAQYISVTNNGNQISVELTVPAAVAAAYAKLLNSDMDAALKEKLVAMLGKDVSDWSAALGNLSLDQLVSVLSMISPEDVYAALANTSFVEVILEKVVSATGLDLESLKDLTNVMHLLANDKVTLEKVCELIEKRVGQDVMALLEKVAVKADDNATVQAYLDKLATVPYIGTLVAGLTPSEILEAYKGVNLLIAVSDAVADRVGEDIAQKLATEDADALWQEALDRASDYEGYYNRVRDAIVSMIDPNVAPTNSLAAKLKGLIPESVLKKLFASSLTDLYRGNGTFSASAPSISLDLGAVCRKLVSVLYKGIPAAEQYSDIIEKFLPDSTVNFGINLKVNFTNIYRVTYTDVTGREVLVNTFLPYGMDPTGLVTPPELEDREFLYWADENGDEVTAITGDMKLIAWYEESEMFDLDLYICNADGEEKFIGTLHITADAAKDGILQEELDEVLGELNPADFGYSKFPAEAYEILWKDEEDNDVNLVGFEPTEDGKFVGTFSVKNFTVVIRELNGEATEYIRPYGTTLADIIAIADIPEKEGMTLIWYVENEDGTLTELDAQPEDILVKADVVFVYEYTDIVYTVTVTAPNGQEFTFQVPHGQSLTAEQLNEALLSATECGMELPDEAYNIVWYLGVGEDAEKLENDVTSVAIKKDTAFSWEFEIKTFEVSIKGEYGNFTLTLKWGTKLTAKDLIAEELTVKLPTTEESNDGSYQLYFYVKTYQGQRYTVDDDFAYEVKENITFRYKYECILYKTLTITFVDELGNKLGETIVKHAKASNSTVLVNPLTGELVKDGEEGVEERTMVFISAEKLEEVLKEIGKPEVYGHFNGDYTVAWYVNGQKVDALNNPHFEDTQYDAVYEAIPSTLIFVNEDGTDTGITVTYTPGTGFVVVKEPNEDGSFGIRIDLNNLEEKLAEGESVTLQNAAEDPTLRVNIDYTTLQQLITEAADMPAGALANTVVTFTASTETKHVKQVFTTASGAEYVYENDVETQSFTLKLGDNTFTKNFAGNFNITVSYDDKIELINDIQRTAVYVLTEGNGLEWVDNATDGGSSATVSFNAPHFSEFVLLNEYLINSKFQTVADQTASGKLNVGGEFIPADAEITHLVAYLPENETYGNFIKEIYYISSADEKISIAKNGDKLTMPAEAITVVAVISPIDFVLQYQVGNKVFADKAAALTELNNNKSVVPLGYKLKLDAQGQVQWVVGNKNETNALQGDAYLTPALELITYTVVFEGAETVTFTVKDFAENFVVPAVPLADSKPGMTGVWDGLVTDMNALIAAMGTDTTKTYKPAYTARTYQIVLPDGTTVECKFNEKYTPATAVKNGYTLDKIVVTNLSTNTEVTLTNGSFTMPASNVKITLVQVPNTLHFSVVNSASGANTPIEAKFDSFATFTITVPKNSVMEVAPGVGSLVSFTVNADGSKTMVYSFLVTEEISDNTQITYRTAVKVPATVNFANGMPTTDEAPASDIKNLTFDKFVSPDNAHFDTVNYWFATYTQPSAIHSYIWLIVLLVIAVLIALIALFYILYIRGHFKPNFFLRFITWLVSIFFGFCLAVSAVVLWILQGTKKREEIPFEEYGVAKPEDLDTEAGAEETAEETTEADETAEEVAEEATEETTAEAPANAETEMEVVDDNTDTEASK